MVILEVEDWKILREKLRTGKFVKGCKFVLVRIKIENPNILNCIHIKLCILELCMSGVSIRTHTISSPTY